jgi:UDP-N-acetylmuramate--alanine ligase
VKTEGTRIHFMGVAGIGMSAIAELAARKGAKVSGCDLESNDNSQRLVAAGIAFTVGHSPEHLTARPDVLVYSSAIPEDNLELVAARSAGIETISRSNMLGRLMEERRSIGVAGTHGKTTTSWLAAKLLLEAGLDPAVMVGGVVPELGSNYHPGEGEWFVTEVDESDGLLLEIRPEISVLLNVDRDHLDHYESIEEIERVFAQYAANTREGGSLIGWGDDPRVVRVLAGTDRESITYGMGTGVGVRGFNMRLDGTGSTFDVFIGDREVRDLRVTLLGQHNVLNSLAVVALAEQMNIAEDVLRRALAAAGSVQRRMQKRGEAGGVAVYDDYGHHPTEIETTLRAAKLLVQGGGKLVVVFQPHRYSRTRHLLEEFGRCFGAADHLVVTSIYSANEPPIEGVSSAQLVERVSGSGHKSVQYVPAQSSIVPHLLSVVGHGDVVLLLGAGDVWKLHDELIQRL